MRSTSTPVNRKYGTTAMRAAPRRRAVVLEMAGAEEEQRHGDDRRRPAGDEAVDGVVEVRLGQLDEAATHVEGRRLTADDAGELPVLGRPGGRPAPVADEQERRV